MVFFFLFYGMIKWPLEEPRLLCVSRFPFSFLWENDKVKINPFNHVVKNHSWWFGHCSHFFFARNKDVSNYPFAEDVKNHVCLVSPAQSKKNLVCPLRHLDSRSPVPMRGQCVISGQNYFVPDIIGTKKFWLGQNSFVPGWWKRFSEYIILTKDKTPQTIALKSEPIFRSCLVN